MRAIIIAILISLTICSSDDIISETTIEDGCMS